MASFGDDAIAVGAGSRLDIFWDVEEVAVSPEGGVDADNLSSTSSTPLQESSTNFFGNLAKGEMGEWSLSPERKKGDGRNVFCQGLSQIGEPLLNIPDVSSGKVPPRKQESVAAIFVTPQILLSIFKRVNTIFKG